MAIRLVLPIDSIIEVYIQLEFITYIVFGFPFRFCSVMSLIVSNHTQGYLQLVYVATDRSKKTNNVILLCIKI